MRGRGWAGGRAIEGNLFFCFSRPFLSLTGQPALSDPNLGRIIKNFQPSEGECLIFTPCLAPRQIPRLSVCIDAASS
ncbi:hypothetical protein AFLA_000837 [Aspergillus flavus NRRL3357]|nr:hypothetical protein AFLA_000837 [Aspergillus flavus NRRL3357]